MSATDTQKWEDPLCRYTSPSTVKVSLVGSASLSLSPPMNLINQRCQHRIVPHFPMHFMKRYSLTLLTHGAKCPWVLLLLLHGVGGPRQLTTAFRRADVTHFLTPRIPDRVSLVSNLRNIYFFVLLLLNLLILLRGVLYLYFFFFGVIIY